MNKNIALLLLSGGEGKRFSNNIPKQFYKINEITILETNIIKFLSFKLFSNLVVVSSKKNLSKTEVLCKKYNVDNNIKVIEGGETRQKSSKFGCLFLKKYNPDIVLIHDVARPFVNKELISSLIKKTRINSGCIPVLKINDTIKFVDKEKLIKSIDREKLFIVQTPQSFHFESIYNAHKNSKNYNFTDDSTLAEANNIRIYNVKGLIENIKITTMSDLKKNYNSDKPQPIIRVGSGFDVHEFTSGEYVTLCGVRIPFNKKLKGHSDADVGIHTIVDAILGALSYGDIGDHFPPSDKKWKNADSMIFLERCYHFVKNSNSEIVHIDLTFICEEPKLTKYKNKMKMKISEILKITDNKINIKATTTESLGFLGRKEGIAALATVTLKL